MSSFKLKVARLFDGERLHHNRVVTVEDGIVKAILTADAAYDEAFNGLMAPGFVDLQVNGGGGVLLNNSPTPEGIKQIATAHARFGTTSFLPTLITDKIEVMEQATDAVAEVIAEKVPGIAGVHFEGPHLAVAKKGAHSAKFIRDIAEQEWAIYQRKDLGRIMVTLAPEAVSPEDIRRLKSEGVRVCLGHTNADYELAQRALDAGADGFTHLFNAMSPLQGREPGVVGAAFLNPASPSGMIVDGHHVDYAACRLAIEVKGTEGIFLVTDAMSPVGTSDTEFDFFDRKVLLEAGALRSTTGELAGSVLDMATAVRNAHQQVGCSLEASLTMASRTPAEFLTGQKDNPSLSGRLKEGQPADFVLLDDQLRVQQTWIAGEQVFAI